MSVGKYMFPSHLASFLAEVVVTAGGEFISPWLWPSQPSVGKTGAEYLEPLLKELYPRTSPSPRDKIKNQTATT